MREARIPSPPHRATQKCLIAFAKVPAPGNVKTRLTDVLTGEEAARLYEAFLWDALDQYRALEDVDVRLYLAPSENPFQQGGTDLATFEQRGDSLGARMANAFVESFAAGYERIVIIGTDHPTLPSAFVDQAFAALEKKRSIAIGPSDDGGYYLLAMNDFSPALFANMTYSHGKVFEMTLDRARSLEAELTVLPVWYDVDTVEALGRLVADLGNGSTSSSRTPPVRTRRVVDELADRYRFLKEHS